ncbi:hypothetical protein PhCBS80983_g04858 [Powellomyces hirtus]|uniref:RNA-dependent RNA polymerase n=1 Tax=Powellomyces hirtus TaxID=109895 RepID=A0A507DW56_9FUNG|nr:hypothetical protein PhCBS80983_g04858 [Powellomyces hirtus]
MDVRRASTRQRPSGAEPDPLPLFVQRLPTDGTVTAQELRSFFSFLGHVIRAKVRLLDNRPTGDAEVLLENPDAHLNKAILDGATRYYPFPREPTVKISVRKDHRRMGAPDNGRHRVTEANPCYQDDKISMARFAVGTLVEPDCLFESWDCVEGLQFEIDYQKYQQATLFFEQKGTKYKLQYRFKNVRSSFKIDCRITATTVSYHILASLSLPPMLFYVKTDPNFYNEAGKEYYERAALPFIAGKDLPHELFFAGWLETEKEPVLGLPDTGRYMDHHYTFVYERENGVLSEEENKFVEMLGGLEIYGVVANVHRFVNLEFIPKEEVPRPYDVYKAPLPYAVKFKLLGLISYNVISEYAVDEEFIRILANTEPSIAEGVLENMMKPKEHIWDPKEGLRKQLEDTAAIQEKIMRVDKLNYNQRFVRKIVITPTKIYFQGPQLELANRVLRTHFDNRDAFIRVTFADDDLTTIGAKPYEMLYRRIETILDAGVTVAGNNFEFLHYSNSSMRTAGCWFVAPFQSTRGEGTMITARFIRGTMGNFSGISNPATLGARMAQCFSSTTVTGKIKAEDLKSIDDVERNGYVFSDGVGKVGKAIIYNICGELRKYQRVRPKMFSALQYRLAGSKGVLVKDPSIPKNEVHLRKSQTKFQSEHYAFEICRTSFYSPGYLNHQYIILLETLGIKKEVFLELRDESIEQLNLSLQKPKEAAKLLAENQDEIGVSSVLIELINAGFFDAKEPFLINQLRLFRALQLKDLKRRARIHVKKACTLLGVMDESGLLPEGKLYVQYTNPLSNKPEVVTGPGIVTRSPCLHPGDVQVIDFVNLPKLSHLVDVVVFSQHGQRPLPNMLAGGDLDGDTFFVSWDPRLIPKTTSEPMNYETGPSSFLNEASEARVKEHFVNFLRMNNLGQIDNAWKAWADRAREGAHNPIAKRLAELHSDAVDFAKKGTPARMEQDHRPKEWPDFMEKPPGVRTYISTKAVGEIYRSVNVDLELVKDFSPLKELIVDGYQSYLEDAYLTKAAYDRQISALMNQYNIRSEFELVSGYMFKLDEAGMKKRPMELKEQVMQAVYVIQMHYRGLFWTSNILPDDSISSFAKKDTVVGTDISLPDQVRKKASAWYMVAYDLNQNISPVDTPNKGPPLAQLSEIGPEIGADHRSAEKRPLTEIEKEEADAAERRRHKAVEREDAEYQGIDFDMSGRFYSFPWIMHDVLCNMYKNAKGIYLMSSYANPIQHPTSTTGEGAHSGSSRGPDVLLRPSGSEKFWRKVAT